MKWKILLYHSKDEVAPPVYIASNDMHMVVAAGLRGAMAYALAYSLPISYHFRYKIRIGCYQYLGIIYCMDIREIFLATTAVIVLFTVFFFGGVTAPLIRYLKIARNAEFQQKVLYQHFSTF